MSKKFTITEDDYIKANRKADREREIERHGKQVSFQPPRAHKSQRDYNRAKYKHIDLDSDTDN